MGHHPKSHTIRIGTRKKSHKHGHHSLLCSFGFHIAVRFLSHFVIGQGLETQLHHALQTSQLQRCIYSFIYRRFCEAKQFAEVYTVALWKCSFPSSQTMLPVLRLTIIGYIHNEDTCCLYNLTNEITRRSRGDPSEQRCDSQSLPRFDLTLKKSLATSANFFTSCSSNPLAMLTLLTIGLGISLHSLRLSRDHLQPHIRPLNQLLDSSTCTTPITDSRAGCCGRWSVSRNITT